MGERDQAGMLCGMLVQGRGVRANGLVPRVGHAASIARLSQPVVGYAARRE